MADNVYFKELESFRDKVIELNVKCPATNKETGTLIYIGNLNDSITSELRSGVSGSTFILMHHPPEQHDLALSIEKSLSRDDKTLLCPLSKEHYYADKSGLLIALLQNKNVQFSIDGSIKERFSQEIENINKQVEISITNAEQSFYGRIPYLRNALLNLPYILSEQKYELSGGQSKLPAVICSAGPSITNNIETLKQFQDKIIIICLYRVLSLFLENGITPDFVVHYDLSDIMKVDMKKSEIPLVTSTTISPNITKQFARIIWANGDSPLFDSFISDNGVPLLHLQRSKTVTSSAIDLAIKLGCRKVALIGADHCLSKDFKEYSDQKSVRIPENIYMKVPGITGEEVTTTANFNGLKIGVENFIEALKKREKTVSFYNCSFHGAVIKNTRSISFDKFCSNYAGTAEPKPSVSASENSCNSKIIKKSKNSLLQYIQASQKFISIAKDLSQELASCLPDVHRLKKLQKSLHESAGQISQISSKKSINFIIRSIENQIKEIQYISSHTNNSSDPVEVLNQQVTSQKYILSFCNDFIKDLEKSYAISTDTLSTETDIDIITFEALREIGIDFISKNNPSLSNYLTNNRVTHNLASNIDLLHLPVSVIDHNKVVYNSDSINLKFSASKQVSDFLNEKRDINKAIIFISPGNLYHTQQLAKLTPSTPLAIFILDENILELALTHSLFTHVFNEESTIFLPKEQLSWQENLSKQIKKWKFENREIIFYIDPDTAPFEETDLLKQKIEKIIEETD